MPIEVKVNDQFVHESKSALSITGSLALGDFEIERTLGGHHEIEGGYVNASLRLKPKPETLEQLNKIVSHEQFRGCHVAPLDFSYGYRVNDKMKEDACLVQYFSVNKDYRGCRGEDSKKAKLERLVGSLVLKRDSIDVNGLLKQITEQLKAFADKTLESYNNYVSEHLRKVDTWKWDKVDNKDILSLDEEIAALKDQLAKKRQERRNLQKQTLVEKMEKEAKTGDYGLPKGTAEYIVKDLNDKGLVSSSPFGW